MNTNTKKSVCLLFCYIFRASYNLSGRIDIVIAIIVFYYTRAFGDCTVYIIISVYYSVLQNHLAVFSEIVGSSFKISIRPLRRHIFRTSNSLTDSIKVIVITINLNNTHLCRLTTNNIEILSVISIYNTSDICYVFTNVNAIFIELMQNISRPLGFFYRANTFITVAILIKTICFSVNLCPSDSRSVRGIVVPRTIVISQTVTRLNPLARNQFTILVECVSNYINVLKCSSTRLTNAS